MGRCRHRDGAQGRQHGGLFRADPDRQLGLARVPFPGGRRVSGASARATAAAEAATADRRRRKPVIFKTINLRALCIAVFMFSQSVPAFADQNHYGIPIDWFACKTSADCGKVEAGCHQVIMSVNKHHVIDAEQLVFKRTPDTFIACTRIRPDIYATRCEQSMCVLY